MSELTLTTKARMDRLERYWQSHREAPKRELDPFHRFLMICLAAVVVLILAVGYAMAVEWSPGHQSEIYAEYEAYRHEAVEVAAK